MDDFATAPTIIGTVKSGGLYLRSGPGDHYPDLDTLTTGDRVLFLDRDPHGNWERVRVIHTKSGKGVGQVGWVNVAFLDLAIIEQPPAAPPDDPLDLALPVPWLGILFSSLAAVVIGLVFWLVLR